MPAIVRVLFPTLAAFGPLAIVIGLQSPGASWSQALALVGALMTSSALLLLYFAAVRGMPNNDVPP